MNIHAAGRSAVGGYGLQAFGSRLEAGLPLWQFGCGVSRRTKRGGGRSCNDWKGECAVLYKGVRIDKGPYYWIGARNDAFGGKNGIVLFHLSASNTI